MQGSFDSHGAADTEALGGRLASALTAGDVVLVEGEMGAGKTTFVRGACRALGVAGPVTSPTFTIGQRYPAGAPAHAPAGAPAHAPAGAPAHTPAGAPATARAAVVAHVDLYRLDSLAGEDPDLLADYVGTDTISFVEWPQAGEEELGSLARVAARVRLEHAGGDRRRVTVQRR